MTSALLRDYLRFVPPACASPGGTSGADLGACGSRFVNDHTGRTEYTVVGELGRGLTANVFRATDHRDGATVALKRMPRDYYMTHALSTYLQRELTVHSQLSHPFVIGFKRVFYTMEFVVMVLEHASHGSLASYEWPGVIGSASRTGMACYFFQQLIAAVAYCHEHGVVHRDLKHENTLVSEESFGEGREFLVLKVSDFGMCREDETPNHASGKGSRVGSVPYMAPEVIQANNIGTPEAGRAADVWACAVHFYKMLFGRLPFAGGADWRAVSTNIVHGNVLPPPPNAANAHILDLLERMFRVDRTQRISVPEIQRHPAFLASLPPEIAEGCHRLPKFAGSTQLPREIESVIDNIQLMQVPFDVAAVDRADL